MHEIPQLINFSGEQRDKYAEAYAYWASKLSTLIGEWEEGELEKNILIRPPIEVYESPLQIRARVLFMKK